MNVYAHIMWHNLRVSGKAWMDAWPDRTEVSDVEVDSVEYLRDDGAWWSLPEAVTAALGQCDEINDLLYEADWSSDA